MIAMRAAASAAVRSSAKPSEFRRLFSIASFMPPPTPAADQVPKAEPNTNLFISGLNKRTTSEKLHEAFSQFGEVVSARVVTDRVSGYSKGFGFVKYAILEDAAKGIEGMDGKYLEGWVIFAEYARPRPPSPGFNQGSPYNQSSS
uniref:RRM domain-containing protein n=1 Tax=Kalanchoe fedtschenkoi TaxID=63787 RepID=A0A7N0ZQ99_KALFE